MPAAPDDPSSRVLRPSSIGRATVGGAAPGHAEHVSHEAAVATGEHDLLDRIGRARATRGLSGLVNRFVSLGWAATDDDDLRVRKTAATLSAAVILVLATAWDVTYLLLDRPLAAAIPLAYQVATVIALAWFARTNAFRTFAMVETSLMTVLPFVLQWSLGGYEPSSAVSLWAFAAVLGSVVAFGGTGSWPCFATFLGLTAVSVVIDPALASGAAEVPSALRRTMFGLNVGGVALVTWLVILYFVRQREGVLAALDMEHRKSERLLANMLPAAIANRLKSGSGVIADHHPAATVLFADVVGFTTRAEDEPAEETVAMLDRLFSAFDDLAAELRLEKIKTIGDAYMVVGGIPEPRADHVAAVADLALAMQAIDLRADGPGGGVMLRIGMHTGPVIAGVIGRRTFAYDLWGDTVNTAARMESHGAPGRIQVTREIRDALDGTFTLEPRGTIEVKGKGPMETWYLIGRT